MEMEPSMLKIYGHPASTCTRKVLMTAAELELPYQLTTIDFTVGAHKQRPHLDRQPFGRVPAIDDDGFEMFESRAIARYLDHKADGPLVPRDPQPRARMEQWISIETSEFSGHAMKFIFEHVFGRKQDPAVLDAATASLDVTLGVLDRQLASTSCLAGDQLTLADIVYMPYLEYLTASPAGAQVERHPHVAAWWARLRDRPTWRRVTGKA